VNDLEIAEALQQAALGPYKYALSCGCIVDLQATLPGPRNFAKIETLGHELVCTEHKTNNFLKLAITTLGLPESWSRWYCLNPLGLLAITQAEFQYAFDEAMLAEKLVDGGNPPFGKRPLSQHLTGVIKDWIEKHPSDQWVMSKCDRFKIYRTGVVERVTWQFGNPQ